MLFSKNLSNTDVGVRLSFPMKELKYFDFPEGRDKMQVKVTDSNGKPWTLCFSKRNAGRHGHPKPVLSSGWRAYVQANGLKKGDRVTIFYDQEHDLRENDDPKPKLAVKPIFRIQAEGAVLTTIKQFGKELNVENCADIEQLKTQLLPSRNLDDQTTNIDNVEDIGRKGGSSPNLDDDIGREGVSSPNLDDDIGREDGSSSNLNHKLATKPIFRIQAQRKVPTSIKLFGKELNAENWVDIEQLKTQLLPSQNLDDETTNIDEVEDIGRERGSSPNLLDDTGGEGGSSPNLDDHIININEVEDIGREGGSSRKIWILLITNLGIELISAAFDQLSSVHKPEYALVAMLMAYVGLLGCITQLAYEGRKQRVSWRWDREIPWFYYSTTSTMCRRFGTFSEIFGLVCAILQSISATVAYVLYNQHADNPVKGSFYSVVFAFGLLCSQFLKDRSR